MLFLSVLGVFDSTSRIIDLILPNAALNVTLTMLGLSALAHPKPADEANLVPATSSVALKHKDELMGDEV